jgi:hypothetical protein
MRGSPIIQAVAVMLIFAVLWSVGMKIIEGSQVPEVLSRATDSDTSKVNVDVEIFFSDKPLRYSLRRPGNGMDQDEYFLTSEGNGENPALHEIKLRGWDDNRVWLDVIWSRERVGGRYFAQVILTAGNSSSQQYTFHGSGKQMHETMEISIPEPTADE